MSYLAEIETTVAGIPCIIAVDEYSEGSYSYHAASDIDYYGECSWTVCDRRGRYAAWLERKLTSADRSRIDNEVAEYFRDEREQARIDAYEASRDYY
jgi:hypothetical protein